MLISSSANVLDAERSAPVPSFAPGGELRRLQDAGVVRIGVVSDVPGLNWKDGSTGKRSGLDVGLARLAAQSLFGGTIGDVCHHIEFIDLTMAERVPACEEGRADMTVALLASTEQRRRQVDFSDPYFGAHMGVVARRGAGEVDLAKSRIAVVETSTGESFVTQSGMGAKVVRVENNADLPRCIEDEEADIGITSSAVIDAQLRNAYPDLERGMQSFHFEPWSIAVRKGSDELRMFLNATLAQVVDEGWLISASSPACK